MNKRKTFAEMTLDELLAKKKVLLGATIGLGIVALIAFAVLLYVAITTKKPVFMAISTASFVSFLPILANLGKLNAEIKTRISK